MGFVQAPRLSQAKHHRSPASLRVGQASLSGKSRASSWVDAHKSAPIAGRRLCEKWASSSPHGLGRTDGREANPVSLAYRYSIRTMQRDVFSRGALATADSSL